MKTYFLLTNALKKGTISNEKLKIKSLNALLLRGKNVQIEELKNKIEATNKKHKNEVDDLIREINRLQQLNKIPRAPKLPIKKTPKKDDSNKKK